MIQFDKKKYLDILNAQGVNAALTALHQDSERFENATFEGPGGYDRGSWDKLFEVREFSRELWETALKSESSSS
jgi:hypothetical protein